MYNLQSDAYRTGRFGEKPDSSAGKYRAISPNPYSSNNMYSVPTSTGTFLNPPRTADSKPAKSLSPSKYNVPTSITGTPSNSYQTNSPFNKIFSPITPSLTTNQINTKFNQVSSNTSSPYHHGSSTNATNSPYSNKYGVSTPYSLPSDFTNLTNNINQQAAYKPSQYYPSTYSNTISPPKSNSDLGKKDTNSNSSHSSPNYSPHNGVQPAKISVQGSGESIAATKEDLVLLNRAKCVMEAGYIDPKKDSNSNGKEEEFGRFSVIKSNFKENPYYYNLDDLPSYRRNETLKTLNSYNEDSSRLSAPSLFQYSIKLDHKIGDYKTFLQKQKASGTKWRDESFPPTIHSLVGENPSGRRSWQDLIWLRPEEFYGENYNLFVNKIEPNDIKQGELGDCYFLSVLSSLAGWPDRIRKIFVDKEKNPVGCYCVRMCVMGEWREIVVDDYFPCDKRTKKPVFTIGNENELWVLILEKAWAKIYGSYDNIEAGLARECLHDLTCAPTTFFLTDDKNEWDTIWKKMLKCEKKNYAMTCGAGDFFTSLSRSSSFQSYDMVNSKGLVGSHAYSLLGAYEVQSKRGRVKLLKLRNPWGKTEWNGAWSDNSSEWDESLKRRFMPEKKDDGVFFIEYSDFLKYFTDIQFCYIHDGFKYSHILTQSEAKHAGYFKFTVTQEGKYYFTINQESKRKFASTGRDKYATVTIVLAKLNKVSNKWEYEHIAGNQRADREVWIKAKLTRGEYMIYSKIWWNQFGENDYALSSYGPVKIKFEQVNKKDYPELLQGAFSSKARKSTKKIDYAREGEPKAYSVVELKDGFVYCYYHNDSKRVLNVEVNYKEFSGLRLRKPFRGRQYQLSVNPGESKVVLAKVLPQENVRQAFSEKARFTTFEGPLPTKNTTSTPKNSNPYQPTTITPPKTISNTTYQPSLPVYNNIIKPIIPTTIPTIIPTTTNTTTKVEYKTDLELLARQKGKKERLQKPNSNESLDIYVYEYKYEEGVVLLYENLTRNWTLNERVEYVGKGLFLLQAKSNGAIQEAEFELRPGSTFKLDFRRIENNPTLKLKFYSKFKESSP